MCTSDIMPTKDCLALNPPPWESCSCKEHRHLNYSKLKCYFMSITLKYIQKTHNKSLKQMNNLYKELTMILLNKLYLSQNNDSSSSDGGSRVGEFPWQRLSIKPQLNQSSVRVPCGANRVPRVRLVVQSSIFWLFILDMGLHLLISLIPENQELICCTGCGQWEKSVVSFKVCKGPVDITETSLCMELFTIRDGLCSFKHLHI